MTAGGLAELVDREAIRAFNESFYFMNYGKSRMLPKGFNTFQFTTVDSMSGSVAALTEGQTPTEVAFNLTGIDVSLTQRGAYATLSDVVLTDAPVDVIAETAYELGVDLARQLDVAYQNVIDASTVNVIYSVEEDATAGRTNVDDGDIFAIEHLFAAATTLKAASAPTIDGYYVAIMHPHVTHDLKVDTGANGWISINQYTNNVEKIFK